MKFSFNQLKKFLAGKGPSYLAAGKKLSGKTLGS